MATIPGPNQPLLSTDNQVDLYKNIFETWRSQVDSSWQRSNYFAAFETAAIGGCWFLAKSDTRLPVGTSIAISIGGILLTIIWYFSTKKTWTYVRHWWDSIVEIEATLGLERLHYDFAGRLEHRQKECLRYKCLVLAIPFLFGIGWVALLILGIVRFTCFMK